MYREVRTNEQKYHGSVDRFYDTLTIPTVLVCVGHFMWRNRIVFNQER